MEDDVYPEVTFKSTFPEAISDVVPKLTIRTNTTQGGITMDSTRATEGNDAYPLRWIDDCLDAINYAGWFSNFDVRSGYHQLPVNE